MFSDQSRYQALPDIVIIDPQGRAIKSKTLRLLPTVSGTFRHTVAESDRLDHLAYQYYKQSQKWWHICDASPKYMSPLALLGKEPVVMTRFPLIFVGDEPPWAQLLCQLSETVGVEKAIMDNTEIGPKTINDQYEWAIIITYNQLNVQKKDLVNIIQENGFEVRQPQDITRIGQPIIIPPNESV